MKFLLIWLALLAATTACNKATITVNDLIRDIVISTDQLVANGADFATIRVVFNGDADVMKCIVNVKTNNGVFTENNLPTLTKAAIVNLDGNIVSEFKIRSSTKHQDINLEFEVAQYKTTRTILSVHSHPTKIVLTADSFSVRTNYEGELRLRGTLQNASGAAVSEGTRVEISDTYLDGTLVGGDFRQTQLTTNQLSQVSAVYSPGLAPPNQYIFLQAIAFDENGTPAGRDTIKIYLK